MQKKISKLAVKSKKLQNSAEKFEIALEKKASDNQSQRRSNHKLKLNINSLL